MQVLQRIGDYIPGSKGSKEIASQIKEMLDPITILANCALMKFKEKDSTITYSKDLTVFIQQPSEYKVLFVPCLPVVRTLKGQSREDTDIIKMAITKTAAWHQPHAEGKEAYKTFFENARDGLNPLIEDYQRKKSTVTADGIRTWSELITKVTTEGVEKAVDLKGEALKVKNLWALKDITRINNLIEQMKEKQGDIPISQEVKCSDEIKQLENLLQLKHVSLRKIWNV